MYFFYSEHCGVCDQVKPLLENAAAQTGAQVTSYDMNTSLGAGIGKANGVTETPTIVIQGGGTLVGSVTEQQIVAAIEEAMGPSGTMAGTGPAASSTSSGASVPTGYSGYLDFFAVDTSGTLWHTPMNGNNAWDSLGGVCTASPAAIAWGSSSSFRLDVFVRGSDGAVWQRYLTTAGWSTWHSLGGKLAANTGPAVSSPSTGKLTVFAEGTDGALWYKAWSGTSWSGWHSLGGKLTSSPGAVSTSVFVRGTDGAVWTKSTTSTGTSWSSWHSLGGQVAPNTGPGASISGWVVVQGTDNQFWQRGSSGWQSLGVVPPEALSASSPGVVSVPANMHTSVSFSSTSGNVWYGIHDVSGLISGWTSVGSPP